MFHETFDTQTIRTVKNNFNVLKICKQLTNFALNDGSTEPNLIYEYLSTCTVLSSIPVEKETFDSYWCYEIFNSFSLRKIGLVWSIKPAIYNYNKYCQL